MGEKAWSYSVGEWGSRVRVYERELGGPLYMSLPDPTRPKSYLRQSLGHRDREEARSQAEETSALLRRQAAQIQQGAMTWAELFVLYERYHVPQLSRRQRGVTKRRCRMWSRFLGPGRDPHLLMRQQWESFIAARLSGSIDAFGRPQDPPVTVRPVTVIRDLECLRAVCRWGSTWRTASGYPLLREEPTRGLTLPADKNPRRPAADRARLDALRAVAPSVCAKFRWGPEPRHRTSYLPEILELVAGTGRRISAVVQLRFEDIRPPGPSAPWGQICWPAATEKTGRETTVPIGPPVRRVLDGIMAARPGVGSAYLFPAPSDPVLHLPMRTADVWLRRAEKAAKLERLDGGLWHPYRRMWATDRKHLPLPDLARAGGWASQQVLQTCYLKHDEETMLRVVLNEDPRAREESESA